MTSAKCVATSSSNSGSASSNDDDTFLITFHINVFPLITSMNFHSFLWFFAAAWIFPIFEVGDAFHVMYPYVECVGIIAATKVIVSR